jgi:hypothetical protein
VNLLIDQARSLGSASISGLMDHSRSAEGDAKAGVLVGPSFPAVMRGGEVELHRARGFNLGVAVELGAVVGGDRLELFGAAASGPGGHWRACCPCGTARS